MTAEHADRDGSESARIAWRAVAWVTVPLLTIATGLGGWNLSMTFGMASSLESLKRDVAQSATRADLQGELRRLERQWDDRLEQRIRELRRRAE